MTGKAVTALLLALISIVVVTLPAVDAEVSSDTVRSPESADDVRLQIYGNANGDDVIDAKDIETLESIIDGNVDDWESTFFYADANQDGVIDAADVQIVRDIIDRKPVRMYYTDFKGNTAFVNYPIGRNVMCDYSTFELLSATHTFGDLMAIDQSATIYIGKYGGLEDCIVIPTNGNNGEHTFESLASAKAQGVDTLIQWTGGGATDYLWEMPGIEKLASEISIVSLTIQGPDCINGALMYAQMLGDISLADDYKKWYTQAQGMFSEIGDSIPKKTVSCIRCFESDERGTYRMYGSEQSPALWFNEVVNFQDKYVGKTGFTVLNSFEELVTTATDEIILMTQRRSGTTYEQFDGFCKERLDTLYGGTQQYEDGKIYMIEWEAMPFFSGPAGCYILAAYLYPEHFDLDDAFDFLQTYLDEFSPNQNADARVGFTYTSAQATSGGDAPADSGSDSTLLYAGAAVAVVIVAALAYFLIRRSR